MAARPKASTVRVRFGDDLPEDVTPYLHVYDTYGRHLASSVVSDGLAKVMLPPDLEGAALRYAVAPGLPDQVEAPSLSDVRRLKAKEVLRPYVTGAEIDIDVEDYIIVDWFLCICVVRGRVVRSIEQPNGTSVDYPVCDAVVHVCEVDKIPKLVWRLPDDLIYRIRDELLIDPFPPDPIGPVIRDLVRPPVGPIPPRPIARRERVAGSPAAAGPRIAEAAAASGELADVRTRLRLAPSPSAIRGVLLDIAYIWPWWCWLDWLDPWFTYDVDCAWTATTDENGEFSVTIIHPCSDTPDLYFWVEQEIGSSWRTIYAKGARCDTYWDFDCGSEVTIRVTDPEAKVCYPPPDVEVPPQVTSWVLPMAVGDLEIAGTAGTISPTDPLGWLQPDATAAYSGGAANVAPITDAPMGGTLLFRMLHSLDFPKAGMEKYQWSYRVKGTSAWTEMTYPIGRHYRYHPATQLTPTFPTHPLGPSGPDALYDFRPHTPPYPDSVWPVVGFESDQWSAGEVTGSPVATVPTWAPGVYEIRVTVRDATGTVVVPNQATPAPATPTFDFLVTDERQSGETYSTRLADPSEIIDGGFVFEVLVDNRHCTAAVDPVATSAGATADVCGFLRYPDKLTTNALIDFEASHPANHAWFTLDVVRGQNTIDQVSVNAGAEVGAPSAPTDPHPTLPAAAYTGDGVGNFNGVFPLSRLLEACDNAAFAIRLYVRAKTHDGRQRLHGYDKADLDAFALAVETEADV